MSKNGFYLAGGRILSSTGDSIYGLTVVWYIYQITHSTIYTGATFLLIYSAQALHFLFGPIIERVHKKRILVYTQLSQFVLMCMVPLAIIFHFEDLYLILTVVFIVSVLENIEGTAEISIVPSLMAESSIAKYNAIVNSAQQIVNVMMAFAFSFIIFYISVKDIYLFNAFTYLIAFLLFMKLKYDKSNYSLKEKPNGYMIGLKEGFEYFKSSIFIWITLPLAIVNGVLSGLNAVIPKYAEELGNQNSYGWIMFSISCGLMIGSLVSQYFVRFQVGRLVSMAALVIFILLILSYFIHHVVISIIILGLALIPLGIINMSLLTFTQTNVNENYLARVVSISESILFIMMPLGAIIGGVIAQLWQASIVILIAAFTFAWISLLFISKRKLKNLPSIVNKE